ncbi:TPA: hypothetical protein ACKPY3_004469 [Serratia marcescens]
MDNKLSELSKPVATVDVQRGRPDGNMFGVAWSSAGHAIPDGPHFLYSQEYVSALLAELEAKDKRIAELEYDLKCVIANNEDCEKTITRKDAAIDTFITEYDEARKIIAELEAKLATPVRLPRTFWYEHDDLAHEIPVLEKKKVVAAICGAGFTVEGDE